MKAYLLTVPNLVSIQSVCKYTHLDEGKYDQGHICPTDKRLILTWGFTFIIFIEGYTPFEKDFIFYVGSGWVVHIFTRPRVKPQDASIFLNYIQTRNAYN